MSLVIRTIVTLAHEPDIAQPCRRSAHIGDGRIAETVDALQHA